MSELPRGEQCASGQVLGAVLRCKAVASAGSMLAWVLQRPELIDADQLTAPSKECKRSLTGLFLHSQQCLTLTARGIAGLGCSSSSSSSSSSSGGGGGGSGSVGTLAAAMTQQMQQSGPQSSFG
ncbi:hypothetical protein OEZ85_004699 [Tetradesmus obliquus]|uniref:Uncharacterized protein n=1 Tax=Tetradesmus obliquus TaxID=3088 RepID=A0ABY8UMA9_TETOB|nr:hypothetical protein OEZ85_004699 [Tetradesmus obliquus]